MKQLLFDLVEQYEIITIYRHIHPDWDAIGAQLGLKKWIESQYPNKQVYALGSVGNFKQYQDEFDEVEDEVISASLAIVLDCGNRERVDDARFIHAKEILKIDHHPNIDHYALHEIVEEKAGATCEIITNLLRDADCLLTTASAAYLYMGIMMDTARFSISTTTAKTFEAAAYLCKMGIDLPRISEECIAVNLNGYQFVSYLRSCMQIYEGSIAYAVINKEDYERFSLTFEEAKEYVYVFNHIQELEVWALFTQLPDLSSYKGSIRSRRIVVNDIASQYHGGGHALASGVSQLSREDIDDLLKTLNDRIRL